MHTHHNDSKTKSKCPEYFLSKIETGSNSIGGKISNLKTIFTKTFVCNQS
jgi:hypothetical protein